MTSERRKPYPFDQIESKWQSLWAAQKTFRALNPGQPGFDPTRPKYYALDMFPYPSGAGLHVGHPEGYTATDIVARYKRMRGFNVLHPMGWDAFGLPAEQYAIKTGQHPAATTAQNVNRFKEQLKKIGFAYDWDREINTTDPHYYKWTQWIFLQLYHSYFDPELRKAQPIELLADALSDSPQRRKEWEKNPFLAGTHAGFLEIRQEYRLEARTRMIERSRLAYIASVPVNWCPELGTVLANEEVVDGRSEVGGFPVVRRPMRQWMLRITKYADRLIDELEGLEWSDSVKALQRNWIGRSEGAEVRFEIVNDWEPTAFAPGSDEAESTSAEPLPGLDVFTTRPDTLYGATYMVLAPEHALVERISTAEQRTTVQEYLEKSARKSDFERTELAREKTGVFTGAFAVNPANGERIPIWIADYVLLGYGTGAIMAVPAHDERDFAFARKFDLPIRQVVAPVTAPSSDPLPYLDDGVAINSPIIDGLGTPEAKAKITAWLEDGGCGKKTVNYKLRDWLFSRQRYWGEPFPIVWEAGAHRALEESELPVEPPPLDDFKPTGTGEPPLAKATSWVKYSEKATRETNTMPQWAGSCWYYLRFCDPHNAARFVGEEAERYWMGGKGAAPNTDRKTTNPDNEQTAVHRGGVDLYVGGTEHAVLHLLYARFWHKVLYDLGHVSTPEPFQRLVNQGTILGEDGQKMSKSRGNVLNPDDVIAEYGADTFRCYEMFMGPLEQMKPWSMTGVEGVARFLARVWRLAMEESQTGEWVASPTVREIDPDKAQLKVMHATIKKVGEDIEHLRFNTAIAAMMIYVNAFIPANPRPRLALRILLQLLNPFAPHLTEELWERLGFGGQLAAQSWPEWDATYLIEDEIEIPVQVNGKLRDKIVVKKEATPAEIETIALASVKVREHTSGKAVRKVIVVPGKLVNVVAA